MGANPEGDPRGPTGAATRGENVLTHLAVQLSNSTQPERGHGLQQDISTTRPTYERPSYFFTMFLMKRSDPMTRESTAVAITREPPTST